MADKNANLTTTFAVNRTCPLEILANFFLDV